MENYLDKLNEQQRIAVEYIDGPSLVIAGAGSGKTRVLTYKIVHLLQNGYLPYNILALTFTNKAAREMKERIASLIGEDLAAQLWMGTFHSIFSKILRINADRIGFNRDFTIYDTNDSKSLIKVIIKDMQLDDKVYNPSHLQSHISNMKNALISPYDYENNRELRQADNRAKRPETFAIYKTYWNRCRVAGAMDFDDLLFYTNILLRDNRDVLEKYQNFFKYVLVDEYQDTNFAQHLIVSQLCKQHNKLCVVGDDAQSIYSFRGANITNILNLSKSYPDLKTFKLEQNYRSTQTIISAANSLIEKNQYQIKKNVFSKSSVGNRIPVIQSYSDFEEGYVVANQIIATKAIQGSSYEDFAVLYRTNAQSRVLEETLRKRNIPYRIYGGLSFYQRKEIKDAIAYFRLTINPNDDEALRRIINFPARGIGDTTVGKIQQVALQSNQSMWPVVNNPVAYGLSVNAGTVKKLQGFASMINSFIEKNENGENAFEVAQAILRDSTILSMVSCDKTPENISKKENLDELLNGISDFVETKREAGNLIETSMSHFLAEVSLATDQDENKDDAGERVTLMTVHAAKGLEFRNVIIVGVEEELFPSSMSSDSIAGIEEERRLLYVAITRAKTNCTMTYASSRYRNGQTKQCQMSRFIRDIDEKYLSLSQTSAMMGGSFESARRSSSWNVDDYTSKPMYSKETKPVGSAQPFKSQPTVRPTSQSAETIPADCTIHDVSEVSEGMMIQHFRFGEGVIESIDNAGADAKIRVRFIELDETKLLMLRFAKFKILK